MVAAGLAMLVLAVAAIVMVLVAGTGGDAGDDRENTGELDRRPGAESGRPEDERVLVCAE